MRVDDDLRNDDDFRDDSDWSEAPADDADLADSEQLAATRDDLPEVIADEDVLQPGFLDQARIPAAVVSLLFHLWLISTLASVQITYEDYPHEPPIRTRIVDATEPLPEPDEVLEYDLANPDDKDHELHEAINARSVGESQTREVKVESAQVRIAESDLTIPTEALYDISEGLELDDRLVIKGTTGEATVQIEAALDRVSWEIAKNLQERRCLVVWLLDASESLIPQREIITKRLERIYGELGALEDSGQIPRQDEPLLSAVVSFGEKTTFVTPEPTPHYQEIVKAVEEAPIDKSGLENVFTAVEQVVKKWAEHRTKNGRRILLITVTDESGDDFGARLEPAILTANRNGARAYVIGPPSVFGRRQGFVPYLHPDDGNTYQLPVDIGPETAVAENVQLPFWFGAPQNEYISAGLGPYALSRLVRETGGVYFMTNMTTTTGLAPTGSYYAEDMKRFEPDYKFSSPEAYFEDLQKHPLRRAVVAASDLSTKNEVKGTPRLELRVTPQNYLQTLSAAQQQVAESTLSLDKILQAFEGVTEADYEKETSPRWRAAYNLSYGRLLAQKVRCYEYNFACASLKLMGTQDVTTKSNHWNFRPSSELNYASSMKRQAQLADKLLRRIPAEAPGTPWAVMASRELREPFGLKIIEQFDPPPTVRDRDDTPTRRRAQLLLAEEAKRKPKVPVVRPAPPKLPNL